MTFTSSEERRPLVSHQGDPFERGALSESPYWDQVMRRLGSVGASMRFWTGWMSLPVGVHFVVSLIRSSWRVGDHVNQNFAPPTNKLTASTGHGCVSWGCAVPCRFTSSGSELQSRVKLLCALHDPVSLPFSFWVPVSFSIWNRLAICQVCSCHDVFSLPELIFDILVFPFRPSHVFSSLSEPFSPSGLRLPRWYDSVAVKYHISAKEDPVPSGYWGSMSNRC